MTAPFAILLIDTDPLPGQLLPEIADDTFPGVTFRQVGNADEAKEHITSGTSTLAGVIWLTINLLDRYRELAFLAWLRATPTTYALPVRLLADGILPCDVAESYTFHATSITLRPFSPVDWKAWLAYQMELIRN